MTENVFLKSLEEGIAETQSPEVLNLQLTGTSLEKLFSSPMVMNLRPRRRYHFAAIACGLATNDTLHFLDPFGNVVTNEHVILNAQAFETNVGLETLVLPCPADDMSVKSCTAISRVLKSNQRLLTLNLPRTELRNEGILHNCRRFEG